MSERFNSRDLIITADLIGSMFGETEFAGQDMDEFFPYIYDYTETDLIEDALDYAIQQRN